MKKIERCKECGMPTEHNELGKGIPISEYHIRCIRCGWPVAKNIIGDNNICSICKGKGT